MIRRLFARVKCKACWGFGIVCGKDGETKRCWKCDGSGEIDE